MVNEFYKGWTQVPLSSEIIFDQFFLSPDRTLDSINGGLVQKNHI